MFTTDISIYFPRELIQSLNIRSQQETRSRSNNYYIISRHHLGHASKKSGTNLLWLCGEACNSGADSCKIRFGL